MPREWQKAQAGPAFKGLLRRRQMQLDDLQYFSALQNVDAYGGSLAKRAGTQFVNGYGSTLTAPTQTGDTVLSVLDGSGFVVGQTVEVGPYSGIIQFQSFDAVGVSPGLPSIAAHQPVGTPVVSLMPAPGEIQTLFHALYRDATMWLYAAVNSQPYRVGTAAPPQPVIMQLPQVTVASGGATTGAVLSWSQGLQVGDWITVGTVPYGVQVQSLDPNTKTVTWSPALPSAPANGTTVTFSPPRNGPSDPPPEMVQYGNYTFFTAGYQTDGTHAWPTPPLVLRQSGGSGSTIIANRCGIKPPNTLPPLSYVTVAGFGLVTGSTYGYRYRYFNSATGQESEASPELRVQIPAAPNTSVQLTLPGSPDPQVDQIRLYRTSTDGGGAWYRVQTVKIGGAGGPNTDTIGDPNAGNVVNVVDFSPDSLLGDQMRDLMDNPIPNTVILLAIWGQANRLIGIDRVRNRVIYSDQPDLRTGRLKGESWPVNNEIFVSYDDGDQLTGLAAFFDSVLVFKEHSVWRITGIPPDIRIEPLHFRQDQTATGAKSQRVILIDHDEVVYRATDAIYELNRFQGQSEGFQSKRLSLPIDEAVQQGFDDFLEAPAAHGVFYRYKRQIRLWESTRRCLVLQFEATTEGEPFGWGEWITENPDFLSSPTGYTGARCSCVGHYDPKIFRGVVAPAFAPGTKLDAAVYCGVDGGLVIQMDVGQSDFGCQPYEVVLGSLQFSPAGRGAPARGRALDFQVQQVNAAQPVLTIDTDWYITPPEVTLDLIDYFTPMDPAQVDLISVPVPPFETVSALVSTPGHHHRWFWREQALQSYYRILGWTYWFQALPEQAVRRAFKQPVQGEIITLPSP